MGSHALLGLIHTNAYCTLHQKCCFNQSGGYTGHLWHVPRWESQGFPRIGNKESQVMWECPKWEKLSVSRMTMRSKLLQGRISHMPLFMHKGNTKFSHLSQAGTCQRRPVISRSINMPSTWIVHSL